MQNGWKIRVRNGHTGLITFPRYGASSASSWRTTLARGGVPFFKTGLPYPQNTSQDVCFVLENKDVLIVHARIGWY
jgi:hypothetical protein